MCDLHVFSYSCIHTWKNTYLITLWFLWFQGKDPVFWLFLLDSRAVENCANSFLRNVLADSHISAKVRDIAKVLLSLAPTSQCLKVKSSNCLDRAYIYIPTGYIFLIHRWPFSGIWILLHVSFYWHCPPRSTSWQSEGAGFSTSVLQSLFFFAFLVSKHKGPKCPDQPMFWRLVEFTVYGT